MYISKTKQKEKKTTKKNFDNLPFLNNNLYDQKKTTSKQKFKKK